MRLDLPAERREQLARKAAAAATRQRGDADLERDRRVRERLVGLEGARHRRGEHPLHGRCQQGRGRVRAVVDVLTQGEVAGGGAAGVARQLQGIDLKQQCRGAALLRRLRVEHVGRAYRQVEGLRAVGVLVQQKAQVRRGRVRGGDGEDHVESLTAEVRVRAEGSDAPGQSVSSATSYGNSPGAAGAASPAS